MAKLEVDGNGVLIDGHPLGEVRRWTVDKRAGEAPTLYVETVGNADLVIDGVEVVQNVIGGAGGAAVAEWLRSIDADKLTTEALERSTFEDSTTKTILEILAESAGDLDA